MIIKSDIIAIFIYPIHLLFHACFITQPSFIETGARDIAAPKEDYYVHLMFDILELENITINHTENQFRHVKLNEK